MNRTFSVAPMLDWTDRHCRRFHRLLTRSALLYTEMVTTGAIIYGDAARHLDFSEPEHPLALQLGGSCPKDLATCSRMAESYGYDEVNLNVGCPSDRVQSGRFGACLMAEPELVADCVAAMAGAVRIPITVKCRIGIDEQNDYDDLQRFVTMVASAGVSTFVVHARKAWLQGLSPKQNRDIPPLNYERVYLLKQEHPELEILINGGITDLSAAEQHLHHVDGVMMGRTAYQNPMLLKEVDPRFFAQSPPLSHPEQIIGALCEYIETEMQHGAQLKYISRHVLGLFQNCPGAKQWRRYISENAHKPGADAEVIRKAAAFVFDLSYDDDTLADQGL